MTNGYRDDHAAAIARADAAEKRAERAETALRASKERRWLRRTGALLAVCAALNFTGVALNLRSVASREQALATCRKEAASLEMYLGMYLWGIER
ncbi:MAG: hypothetical protein AAB426_06695 [Myxococcota bacterium]